ncbi:MAG: ATP-dependent sacrificial sulfur transferase LarE [Anaerolineae bacterium]|nr:ATP-dependent sacrificial sulfur transferase LarE [Anaerolineae bacterium]
MQALALPAAGVFGPVSGGGIIPRTLLLTLIHKQGVFPVVISLNDIKAAGADQLSPELEAKYARLRDLIGGLGRVIVAYSGGVDSTLVAKVAADVLGERMLAVMALSESYSAAEIPPALALLEEHGIPHRTVHTSEVQDAQYAANPANRCYFCKVHLYDELFEIADEGDYAAILDGSNADDVGDHRPGRQAGRERGVRSPLQEAGLNKADIRALARHLGLSNWNKPAMACLSSRVAYGHAITPEILQQIDRAEAALRALGLSQLRVRHHDLLARIEVPAEDLPAVVAQREQIVADLRAAGYVYVTLDLQGFRSGSGNEVLTAHD